MTEAFETKLPVDEAAIAAFRRDGAICIRGALDGADVEGLRDAVAWSMDNPGPHAMDFAGDAAESSFFGDVFVWTRNPAYRDLAVTEALGGIDVYVHNTSAKPQRKPADWINNFNVDLMALVVGVGAATEALTDRGGSVISIGTTATAEHFAVGFGSYTAFKAAVTNWTLGQAQMLGAQGVRCNVVSPGPIFIEGGDWDMIKNHMADFYAATEKNHPQGRLGTAQDVADAVTFLVSDRARHINGVNLTVDGGFLKRIDF